MKREHKWVSGPMTLKSLDEDEVGTYVGYGSVFGNIDFDGDIIAKGAFRESLRAWKAKNKLPPAVWQHNMREPVGPHVEMKEDSHGLSLKGRLLVDDVQKAREAHALMKSGVAIDLSVGFVTMEARSPRKNSESEKGAQRVITKADLWEVSIVTAGSNPLAEVSDVKSVHDLAEVRALETLSEMEEYLRDAGFSRKAATAFIAKCRKNPSDSGAGDYASKLMQLVQS